MYYFIYGCLGLLSGLVFYYLAIHHVKVRSEYDNGAKLKVLKDRKFIVVWMAMAALLFLIVSTRQLEYWSAVRVLLFAMLALNVSAVDIMLRRIPNAILLGMIFLQIVNMSVQIYRGADAANTITTALIGFTAAYIVFLLPAMFKLSVGAGDVKYSATIGFMLGFVNYVEAMMVMAFTLILFYLYLKITKTGGMKTAAPMAPFLSVGTFVAMLFPMVP